MNYPVDLTFKLIALASQIYVRDANGALLGYVKQKLLKLKEDINVYSDESMSSVRFNIKADRVLDFSANYRFTGPGGSVLGSVKRKGMRSIWKAHYQIFNGAGAEVMQINEENGWIKVIDAVVGEIPVIGMFTGYLFHPAYIVSRSDTSPLMRVSKQPAFFESKFRLEPLSQMAPEEETLVLLSVLTMALLERSRG